MRCMPRPAGNFRCDHTTKALLANLPNNSNSSQRKMSHGFTHRFVASHACGYKKRYNSILKRPSSLSSPGTSYVPLSSRFLQAWARVAMQKHPPIILDGQRLLSAKCGRFMRKCLSFLLRYLCALWKGETYFSRHRSGRCRIE